MADQQQDNEILILAHKKFAAALFNRAWELIDKKDRTKEEEDEMVNASHSSAYHWSKLEGHVDQKRWEMSFTISHYQLSRIYADLGVTELALYHGNRALEYCEKYDITDFNLGFAYERLAWAHHLDGNTNERSRYINLAREVGKTIEEKEDRDYFLSELGKVPGYGEL